MTSLQCCCRRLAVTLAAMGPHANSFLLLGETQEAKAGRAALESVPELTTLFARRGSVNAARLLNLYDSWRRTVPPKRPHYGGTKSPAAIISILIGYSILTV